MTREEAKEILEKHHMWTGEPSEIVDVRLENEALQMAIKALEQVSKLQNRCYALTKGTMCAFCRYECQYKAETEVEDGNNNL